MPSRFYTIKNGELVELAQNKLDVEAPNVCQDTIPPLKHPVTGEIVNSRSEWNRINKLRGLECVGNDLLSHKSSNIPDRITDAVIMDKMEQAEAILSDPARRRAFHNMNLVLAERNERLLRGQG